MYSSGLMCGTADGSHPRFPATARELEAKMKYGLIIIVMPVCAITLAALDAFLGIGFPGVGYWGVLTHKVSHMLAGALIAALLIKG
jgi:hypothetical protein